jgi:hypothetical protein
MLRHQCCFCFVLVGPPHPRFVWIKFIQSSLKLIGINQKPVMNRVTGAEDQSIWLLENWR